MNHVWKFELPIQEECAVEMPFGCTPFLAEAQEGKVCVWAICSDQAATGKKHFRLHKTGNEVKDSVGSLKYLGTAKIVLGQELGVHVFEVMT